MQVYIELSALENFCMDFTLLYSAKLVLKNPAGLKKIAFAAAFGGAFAVLFPLLIIPVWAQITLKILSAFYICLLGGRFSSFKSYIKFTGLFLGLSALLAGALYAVFSLSGLSFSAGAGYILSSVPVGIPLFGAMLIFIGARFIKAKIFMRGKEEFPVKITLGKNSVSLRGFFDSGNKLYKNGSPVTVIPRSAAEKLLDVGGIKSSLNIHTVAGSKKIKVFYADITLSLPSGEKSCAGAAIGVSAAYITSAVIHPDILED